MESNVDILSNPKAALWKFSIPVIFLGIFQAVYSMIDLLWVSQLSQQAFYAVSVTTPLITLMTGFADAIGTGADSLISRELGKKDLDESYNTILHCIVLVAVLSLFFIISTFFLKDIMALMQITESVDLAIAYITPMFLFSFVFLLSSLFSSTLQAEGNSVIPTRLLIISNVLNLILDPVLIFAFKMGVAGAAYASIISSAITVIYFLYWYLSGKTQVVLDFSYFKPGIVYDIFIVAIPNLIMSFMWSLAMTYIIAILNEQLGTIGVLLYSTSMKIETLLTAPEDGFGTALITISGQLYGAGKTEKLTEIYKYALKLSMGVVTILAIIFFFIRDYGFALFSVTGAETYVFYIALVAILLLPCDACELISNKMLDGFGKSYHSLILSVAILILDLILVTLLSQVLTSGFGVLYGLLIGQVIFAFLYYFMLIHLIEGKNKLEDKIHEKIPE